MTSICLSCKHFKQTAPLSFHTSGYCDWKLPSLPYWLHIYASSDDDFYGPQKGCGVGRKIDKCDTFEKVADDIIAKRKSEEWYD